MAVLKLSLPSKCWFLAYPFNTKAGQSNAWKKLFFHVTSFFSEFIRPCRNRGSWASMDGPWPILYELRLFCAQNKKEKIQFNLIATRVKRQEKLLVSRAWSVSLICQLDQNSLLSAWDRLVCILINVSHFVLFPFFFRRKWMTKKMKPHHCLPTNDSIPNHITGLYDFKFGFANYVARHYKTPSEFCYCWARAVIYTMDI